MNAHNAEMKLLPASMKSIAEIIGFQAALKMISAFGGTRVSVPKTNRVINDNHRICKVIGVDLTRLLVAYIGGEVLHIPQSKALDRARRNTEILALYDEGMSAAKLARKFQLTETMIYKILNNPA
ncbi:MAG: helix-turn-helix domain-containing protein [Magnetococcales bacterium]|nr:helix-turn-helix domain-containing protein [Magnetococcales bacterium]